MRPIMRLKGLGLLDAPRFEAHPEGGRREDDSGSGSSPHHDCRFHQAKRGGFLARCAGDAVRPRAAQSGQRQRKPPLLRPGTDVCSRSLPTSPVPTPGGRRRATSVAWNTWRSMCREPLSCRLRLACASAASSSSSAIPRVHGLIYLQDPQRLEGGTSRLLQVEAPEGVRAVDVLMKARILRFQRGRPSHHGSTSRTRWSSAGDARPLTVPAGHVECGCAFREFNPEMTRNPSNCADRPSA